MKPVNTSFCLGLCLVLSNAWAQETATLPGTQPLTLQGDLSSRMVDGIDKFLLRELERSVAQRSELWHRDFSSREAYETSIAPNRERFRKFIGTVDPRLPVNALEYGTSTTEPSPAAEHARYTLDAAP